MIFLIGQLGKEGYSLHHTEIKIVCGYVKMVCYLLCKPNSSLAAQRTIPLIMQLFSHLNKVGIVVFDKHICAFEDDDDVNQIDLVKKA